MNEKPIYVVKPSLPPLEEYVHEIQDMWETGIMTHQGPKHQALQCQLQEYLEAENITLFANGHLSLELGIQALELNGEVITTPFTFASTTQAILRNGLRPVFCDINKEDFTIDSNKIENLINENTVAILPVHVYGNICDVEAIQKIADKHHLKVIYDGAHAFGEKYQGRAAATYGDMTMFSFHATKVFNTVEGGCICYRDPELTEHLEGLRQFGQLVGTDSVPYVGTNAKLTEMHAAMGLCNLKHFGEYISKREKVVQRYRERLSDIEGLTLSVIQTDVTSNYAYFPLVIEEKYSGVSRDMVIDRLKEHSIYVRKYFSPLCSDFECIKEMGIEADVPVARYVSDRVITLPVYSDLDLGDVDRICDLIVSLYM